MYLNSQKLLNICQMVIITSSPVNNCYFHKIYKLIHYLQHLSVDFLPYDDVIGLYPYFNGLRDEQKDEFQGNGAVYRSFKLLVRCYVGS